MTQADIDRIQAQTAEQLAQAIVARQRKIEAERLAKEKARAAERAKKDEHYRQARARQAGRK